MFIAHKSQLLQIRWCGVAHSRKLTDFFEECRFPKKWPRGSDWSDSKFKSLHSTGKIVLSNSELPAPIKTLIMILIFQLEISRLMCICWHKFFFNQYTYFCVSYIIVICERIRQCPFKFEWMHILIMFNFKFKYFQRISVIRVNVHLRNFDEAEVLLPCVVEVALGNCWATRWLHVGCVYLEHSRFCSY